MKSRRSPIVFALESEHQIFRKEAGIPDVPGVELRSERGSTSTARVELFPEVPLGVPPPGRRPRFT